MEKLFNPDSIAIIGLSSKKSNIPKLVLENLIRWGYKGRIFGISPSFTDVHVNGIKMYKDVEDLPIVPDLAFALVPAKYVPGLIEKCGKFGIKRMAIPSGGFNELGEEGAKLADLAVKTADKYDIKFVGPNGVTVANTANGLCLPFIPSYSPPIGGFSFISQSGGVGLMLWNLMTDENIGMAKFASIGNKLNLDEVDFLEYFGRDPETKIIGMYLESIPRGDRLIEAAMKIDKPIIILKSNTTEAGQKMAMSHTAALSNNDDIVDSAFKRAGIIRINNFTEFISVAKAFELPPLRGNRLMVMSPAGGFTVMMADYIEKIGFEFADPGQEFYDSLSKFSNAGVINFGNPLDMGDIYDMDMYAHIFYNIMHNENVDGSVFVSQWPHMPRGDDVFYKMFQTDLSKEATGTMLSSGKPIAACLFGLSKTMSIIKQSINFPIFDSTEEMIGSMKKQCDYYAKKKEKKITYTLPENVNIKAAKKWVGENKGVSGEESMELLEHFGISVAKSVVVKKADDAAAAAQNLGYPVVMKIVSPDAVHKTDAGGVVIGVADDEGAVKAFNEIEKNLYKYKKGADFQGVRIMEMAADGYDMFIGGNVDASFGSAVFFGYGGIYIEVFRDVKSLLCPSHKGEIESKLQELKTYKILQGMRGKKRGDINGYVSMIERITYLMHEFPQIKELDLNPVRILEDGSGVIALDSRIRID